MFITSLNKDNIFNLSKVSYIFIKCVGNVHSEIDDWETKLLGKSACNCKKKDEEKCFNTEIRYLSTFQKHKSFSRFLNIEFLYILRRNKIVNFPMNQFNLNNMILMFYTLIAKYFKLTNDWIKRFYLES